MPSQAGVFRIRSSAGERSLPKLPHPNVRATRRLKAVFEPPVTARSIGQNERAITTAGQVQINAGEHADDVVAWLERERADGLVQSERMHAFARDVSSHRDALRELVCGIRDAGSTIAGYGSPAKASTLLNYCDLGADIIAFTVDRNPLKVGRYVPGVHIPILAVERVLVEQPGYLMILPWNLEAEIRAQEQVYADRGGRFIVPIPRPRIV